ncbi:MAG: hypothetical protein JXR76_00925 [Deltaproteobacteria bacterium]|nr:hypothetical protein [Deltaproteobacteria bacterium]
MPSKSLMLPATARAALAMAIIAICVAIFMASTAFAQQFHTDVLVTYVSPTQIYLSGGKDAGIFTGDSVTIMRNGETIARGLIDKTSDTGAVAILIASKTPVREGDIIVPMSHSRDENKRALPQTARRHRESPPNWSNQQLQTQWQQSLVDDPPVKVVYNGTSRRQSPGETLSAAVATEVRQYSYFQSSQYLQTEQTVWFSVHGANLWQPGLAFAIDGSVRGRYDNHDDAYLNSRRAIPLIRTLALTYRMRQYPFVTTLGRFTPNAPVVHTIDGLSTELESRRFAISLFGGLQPDEEDLMVNVHRTVFGLASRLSPGKTGRYTVETVAMAQMYKSHFYRAAIGINNRYFRPSGFHFTQSAVLDLLSTQNTEHSKGDVTLSRAAVDAVWPIRKRVGLDLHARHIDNVVFSEDGSFLPKEWLTSVSHSGSTRLETGLSVKSKRNNLLRPYIFGLGDLTSGSYDGALGGVGFSVEDKTLFSSRTGILTVVDYGIGTGQRANIDVTLNTPLKNSRLYLLSGLFTTWNWVYESDVHTLRNLAFAMLRGQLKRNFDITANWQVGYDHALVRLTYPFGVWMQFQLGITARY